MRKIFTFLFFIVSIQVWSQNCQMTVSSTTVCIGNTSLFSVKFDAGLTAISYSWNFGNTATSTQSAPVYQYPVRGTFTPSVTVNFSNSTSCTINGPSINVVDKPKADFVVTTEDTQCFNGNQTCITDLSAPGLDNSPLSTRVVLFGDGSFNNSAPGSGTNICHSYTSPIGNAYSLVLEVVDGNGCLARKEIQEAVIVWSKMNEVSFSTNYTPQCNQTPVQFINSTKIPQNQVKRYLWDFGDGQTASSPWNNFTHIYTQAGTFAAKLMVEDLNGCRDTFTVDPAASNNKIDSTIYLNMIGSCFRANQFSFQSKNSVLATINWNFYRIGDTTNYDSVSNIPSLSQVFSKCGQYRVTMYVSLGTCKSVTDTLIDVFGPQAVIETNYDPVINSSQCEIHDTVWFRSPPKDYSCLYKNTNIYRLWDFDDAFAPNCTTDTKNNINVGLNCRYSKDSAVVYHIYKQGEEKCYKPKLILTDMASGCTDTSSMSLKLTAPDAGWDSTSNPIRRGLYYTGPTCLLSPIRFWIKETLPLCGRQRAYINLDSACGKNVWTEIDSTADFYDYIYNSTCNPSGWVTVGLIIKNGFDKNGNVCMDTAWYHHMFRLFPVDPSFKLTRMNSGCGPWNIKLSMIDSIQDSLKTVTFNFNNQQTITLNFGATDSIIPSQYFTFTTQGLKRVTVTTVNTRNCSRVSTQQLAFGFIKTFIPRKETLCVSDTLKVDDLVQYFSSNYPYWRDPQRASAGLEQIFWDFGEGGGFNVTGSIPGYKYSKPGNYRLRMVAVDSLGCKDTVTFPRRIRVVDMVASIKPMLPRYLCAPQILRFNDLSFLIDSSAIYGSGPYDSIVKWTWDFGENKNLVLIKDPVYDYTSNGLFNVKLKINSYHGCEDTASIPVFIDGPTPSFTMSDTLGCSPLNINFTNTTGKPLINWIWFFRDVNNSILSTQKDTNVTFTYDVPGIYKVYLLGEDTLFDPINGIMKTCRSVFPDSLNINAPLRRLRVTESVKANIVGPDTVCVGVPFVLNSKSVKLIPGIKWNMGDGNLVNTLWPDTSIKYTYNTEGDFRVSLLPQIGGGVCIDSSWKMINASSVEADFEFDESKAPSYQMNNLSKRATRYEWDFGQPRAGSSNFSAETNPFHTFLPDTGVFTICLKAFNNQDCYDSICKTTEGKVLIVIPNVFSPNNDNKNDAFDIDIQGGRLYDLKIFNRWGDVVYEGEKDGIGNDGNNWNGKNKNTGAECPDGVYYFVFTYRLLNMAEPKNVRGSITLIR